MKNIYFSLTFFLFLSLTSCAKRSPCEDPILISLNIIDRNGLNETITTKDRLEKFEKVDFTDHQPYQKVLRAYSKDAFGNAKSLITSYYSNGQIKQSLEAINNRAYGPYKEWYEKGSLKLEAFIIGGIADLSPSAEKSWQFDCQAKAWDDEGNLLTDISYNKGLLEGISFYYHSNGQVWKAIPYYKNQVHGTAEYFLENGQLLQTLSFKDNEKDGTALRFWSINNLAADEFYSQGKLLSGCYFDPQGKIVSQVINGNGFRAGFGKHTLSELQEFKNGIIDGEVSQFDEKNRLVLRYRVENGLKHGEEYEYFVEKAPLLVPKLLITWYQGKIQGYVKSWYESGNIESAKEMINNKKNGLASVWYLDGSLMMLEEYDQDRLIKGEYFKKNERVTTTEVINGAGIVSLFDPNGLFIRKITYDKGKPVDKR